MKTFPDISTLPFTPRLLLTMAFPEYEPFVVKLFTIDNSFKKVVLLVMYKFPPHSEMSFVKVDNPEREIFPETVVSARLVMPETDKFPRTYVLLRIVVPDMDTSPVAYISFK